MAAEEISGSKEKNAGMVEKKKGRENPIVDPRAPSLTCTYR